MSITSIIIDNQTKATKLDSDKIQLDLLVFPVDEENNMEPEQELRLYINNELFGTLKSDAIWEIRKSIVIKNEGNEKLLIRLEETVSKTQSKVKYILIQDPQKEEKKPIKKKEKQVKLEDKYKSLYSLHQKTISEFKVINEYFQELIKPKNKHDDWLITSEFDKISILADLKYQMKKAKELEFYDEYKDEIEAKVIYCRDEMTIHEINTLLREIQGIISVHDANVSNFRYQKIQAKTEEENNKNQELLQKKQQKRNNIDQQINKLRVQQEWLRTKRDKISNNLNRIIYINNEVDSLNIKISLDTKKMNALPEVKSVHEEWYRISDERSKTDYSKDYLWKLSQSYINKIIAVEWKLQKYSELLWHALIPPGWWICSKDRIQQAEVSYKNCIDQDSLSIKKYEEELNIIKKEIGNEGETTIDNINKEINELSIKIQNLTNEKNAI